MAGGINGPHSADVTEHIRSSNVTGPGTRVHFRSPMGKHLSPDYTVDKNVSCPNLFVPHEEN